VVMKIGYEARKIIYWILISICIIASSGIHKVPGLKGDSREYLLMTQAFISHGTPSVRESDVEDFLALPGNASVADNLFSEMLASSPPFYSSKSGGVYSYHFWLFPLIFSPFVLLTRLMGLADTSGYLLGNVFFVCLVAWCFLRSKRYDITVSILGVVLFFSIGGMYYIGWTHPEIFSASLLCIGLIFLRDGRIKASAFLVALAGQQNPPIILLLPLIFILDVKRIFRDKSRFYGVFRDACIWVFVALISVLSSLFYQIEFGVLNLISSEGMADASLISVHRFSSLFFDPNLGVFWAIPFAFIAAIGVLILRFAASIEWRWVFYFVLMAAVCVIPSLSAPNWNSDMMVISRYGFWCAVPLVFAFLEIFKCVERRCVRFYFVLFMIFSQVGLVYFNKMTFPSGSNYVEFHPWAQIFLEKIPHFYSPIPEVFIERGINNEAVDEKRVYYWVNLGRVEKVLFNRFRQDYPIGTICSSGTVWRHVSSLDRVENGWSYLNLEDGCLTSLGDGFHSVGPVFSVSSGQKIDASSAIFEDGWSVSEVSHRWSLGRQSILRFKSPDVLRSVNIYGNAYGMQNVDIKVNGESYLYGDVSGDGMIAIDLSEINPYEGGMYELIFYWKNARQASDADVRVIAFAVTEIQFE